MSLFKDSKSAWHDAILTREGVQDPFTPSIHSTAPNSNAEIREASLAKVRRCINKLPKAQREAGDWCYGPDKRYECRNRVMQVMYTHYQERNGTKFVSSLGSTTKVLIMVSAAVEDVRYRAVNGGEALLSHSEVAKRMGINRSSFHETWRETYEEMINMVHQLAKTGLTEVEVLVNQMNQEYQRAG